MHDETRQKLPVIPEENESGILRREMLKLAGAGLALAACEPPRGEILPYVRQPREIIPGKAQSYATSLTERGIAWGVIARSYAGRPVKVDGNPDHPTTLGGGSTPQLQAAIYDLYDPLRGKGIRRGDAEIPWSSLYRTLREVRPGGQGLHFLLEPTSSPLLISQIERVRAAFPRSRFHFFDPLASAGEEEALRQAFGAPRRLRYRFDRAWSIASFDADFTTEPPERIRYAFDFASRRRARNPGDRMNCLWVAEGDLSLVGATADERMRARPSAIPSLLASLVGEIARLGGASLGTPAAPDWIRRLARDLWAKRGASLVLVGDRQPAEAHLACLYANHLLGNFGRTIEVTQPVIFEQGEESHSLAPLIAALEKGQVDTLALLGGDPARTAPPDLGFPAALRRARRSIYLGIHQDQTAALSNFYVSALHPFEAWGDARAHDGTISFIQPLIHPLWGGVSPAELLAAFLGDPRPSGEKLLRQQYASLDIASWQTALQWGFLRGALPHLDAAPDEERLRDGLRRAAARAPFTGIELSIRPDRKIRDGSASRNGWLVELPDPITSIQWGNAALMSPSTAERLGVREERVVEIRAQGESVRIPALPLRGMADDVIALAWGWGHPGPGWAGGRARAAEPVGVDISFLRSSDAPWLVGGAEAEAAFDRRAILGTRIEATSRIARDQVEHEQHGRPVLLTNTAAGFARDPDFVHPHNLPAPNIYGRPWTFSGQQWGMSIDLSTCLGCSACVVACQAENNTPVVGETNCRKSRAMHWLRIDRYYSGGSQDDVQYLPQPMLCQHCEMAPCEYVCPVNATVHSPDGLNEMIYNRCIGTRFCSNNCPYKVRRFNYFRYNRPEQPETLKMIHNPEVTARERGVMEKCTFCVQRIRMAEIDARVEGRRIREGEVKTACQEACPTQCIVFGLISDPDSEVSRLRESPRAYALLNSELGTEPRVRYLAHLRNTGEEGA